jgi:hypothetical protein
LIVWHLIVLCKLQLRLRLEECLFLLKACILTWTFTSTVDQVFMNCLNSITVNEVFDACIENATLHCFLIWLQMILKLLGFQATLSSIGCESEAYFFFF